MTFNFRKNLKSGAALIPKNPGVNQDSHHLLLLKEPGEVLVALRNELQKHPDVTEYANKGANFEECLARIATFLDIALDGLYDPIQLMEMLLMALRNKGKGVKEAHKLAPNLIDVELEEREDEVRLVERNRD